MGTQVDSPTKYPRSIRSSSPLDHFAQVSLEQESCSLEPEESELSDLHYPRTELPQDPIDPRSPKVPIQPSDLKIHMAQSILEEYKSLLQSYDDDELLSLIITTNANKVLPLMPGFSFANEFDYTLKTNDMMTTEGMRDILTHWFKWRRIQWLFSTKNLSVSRIQELACLERIVSSFDPSIIKDTLSSEIFQDFLDHDELVEAWVDEIIANSSLPSILVPRSTLSQLSLKKVNRLCSRLTLNCWDDRELAIEEYMSQRMRVALEWERQQGYLEQGTLKQQLPNYPLQQLSTKIPSSFEFKDLTEYELKRATRSLGYVGFVGTPDEYISLLLWNQRVQGKKRWMDEIVEYICTLSQEDLRDMTGIDTRDKAYLVFLLIHGIKPTQEKLYDYADDALMINLNMTESAVVFRIAESKGYNYNSMLSPHRFLVQLGYEADIDY